MSTPGTLAKFTDTETLEDSLLVEDEGTLLIAATLIRPTANEGCSLGMVMRRFASLFAAAVAADSLQVDGMVKLTALPTSDPAVAGLLWNDNGAVKISAG